jgi:hypothetical protein
VAPRGGYFSALEAPDGFQKRREVLAKLLDLKNLRVSTA